MVDATAQARERAQQGAQVKAKIVEESYGHDGTPTPTQEENDLAALGVPMETHQDDGSGPQPEFHMTVTRHAEARPGGGYATRSVEPQRSAEQQRAEQHPAPVSKPR